MEAGNADLELRRDSLARQALRGETANHGALDASGRRPALVVGGGLGGGNPVAGTLTLLAEMFSEV